MLRAITAAGSIDRPRSGWLQNPTCSDGSRASTGAIDRVIVRGMTRPPGLRNRRRASLSDLDDAGVEPEAAGAVGDDDVHRFGQRRAGGELVDRDDAVAEAVGAGELARQLDDAADFDGVDPAGAGLTGQQAEDAGAGC